MPKFAYAVRDSRGQTVRGSVEADSAGAAAARLRSEGYFVTALGPETAAGPAGRVGTAPEAGVRVSAKALGVFCQQVGTLLKAGVPVTNALRVAATQPGKKGWNEVVERVRRHVEAGESLSGALTHFPRSFPNLLVRLVEAGETSGNLDKTFERLAGHYTKEHELRQKVLGAMTYPAVITFVALLVVVILLVFVLPNFVGMFGGMGIEMPGPTRAILALGNVIQSQGLFILIGLVAAALAFSTYLRTEAGQAAKDGFLLRVPLLRDLVIQIELARFAHTFGALLAGGVPVLQGIQIVSRVAGNRTLARAFERMAEAIRSGASLAGAMEKTGVIPGMTVQMVAVGETTGALDLVLENVADLYDREVDSRLKAVTTLIEPAIIVVVGLLVAFIIASVMLPMFQMIGKVQM